MLIVRIATTPIPKPAGRNGGLWRIDIEEAVGGAPAVPAYEGVAPEMPWPTSLPVGDYRLKGRRLDTESASLGSTAEAIYPWTGEGAEMVDVAGGISVVNV